MLISNLIEMLKEYPEDFDVCLSGYFVIDDPAILNELNDGDNVDNGDGTWMVVDQPILALAANEESKEIRLIVRGLDIAKDNGELKRAF